ncbi:MAG TPA: hypothetical protein VK797_06060 [Tepidisphaeraceae bacterium]|jgi:hypothetical protein|nr:hypothetical protein [Tepidisphaeraceae bacterium]
MSIQSYVEPLESRQLFSTVMAVGALYATTRAIPGDYNGVVATGHANFTSIEAELKSAGELKRSGSALKSWAAHATAASTALSKDLTKTIALIKGDVLKLEAAASHLKKNPTSTALQNAQAAAVTKIQNDASSDLSLINGAISNMASVDTASGDQIIALNENDANLKSAFELAGSRSSDARDFINGGTGELLTDNVPGVITALTGIPTTLGRGGN